MTIFSGKILCILTVWLTCFRAYGQVVAPVEWEEQGPRRVGSNYLTRGWCRYRFSQSYQPGEFKVNVTFDKHLTKFDDFNSWERLDSEPGYWFYSQSKWWLNNGQEQRIEFNVKWRANTGIEQPNGQCLANVGTASVTSAPTTQPPVSTSGTTSSASQSTTTSSRTTSLAQTTTATPRAITTAAPQATTTSSGGCGIPVIYGHKWMDQGLYVSIGECQFTFDQFVPTGQFKVNVSFNRAVSNFNDYNNMVLIATEYSMWYYSRSKWPFNENQDWGYSFQVSWDNGDYPEGHCYTNLDCRDVTDPNPVTTTAAPTTAAPTTAAPTTAAPTTAAPTTAAPTTEAPTTETNTPVKTTTEAPMVTTTNTAQTTTASPTVPASTVTTTESMQTTTLSGTTASGSEFPSFNYAQVIDLSMDFFAAQRSGALPDNRIPWRGDSALGDSGDNGEDLTGGYYDAGDHVKFNFPMASSMTLLAWGQYIFPDGYEDFGLSSRMQDTIKWGLDYFLKCWNNDLSNPVYYGQVGNGGLDHSYWGRPEEMTMDRPAYSLNRNRPGSDLAAETAAALAAGSLVFRNIDPSYSATLLDNAKSIYEFAVSYRGKYSDSIRDAAAYYQSFNGYNDELMLGAAILYEATGDIVYKIQAENLFPASEKSAWALSWDDKNVLAHLILYNITGNNQYRQPVDDFLRRYRGETPGSLTFIDNVLPFRSVWGPLRYAANAAMVAVLAADAGIEETVNLRWAQTQIDYMLGDNNDRFSYVIGFGDSFPLTPHHRSSSCPDVPASCTFDQLRTQAPNPQILKGALIGGPDSNGNFDNDRENFQTNEVACDYNAGFTTALAGLMQYRAMLV